MVFGGLSKDFIHAERTESFLNGKVLNDMNVLTQAFQMLSNELVIDDDPVLASVDYRRSLALSLFYKFILYANDKFVSSRYKSGKDSVIDMRPISSGHQSFPTDPTLYPVSKPLKKLNAYLQASGEAQYVYDQTNNNSRELFGAFIKSTIGNCNIDSIDASAASALPGVVKIIFAKDIPGVNSFVPTPLQPEKLFCDDFVDYNGQAIGLVVAETQEAANAATNAVKITYKNIKKPILNVFDAINASSFFPKPVNDFIYGDPDSAIKNAPLTIENEVLLDTQYPFFMENHVCQVEPTDDGFDVNCSTQWLDLVQNGVAQVLNIPNSSCINVKTKQIGGGYGGKITRYSLFF
jgi:xanthine dehydrogenase/oxidase